MQTEFIPKTSFGFVMLSYIRNTNLQMVKNGVIWGPAAIYFICISLVVLLAG